MPSPARTEPPHRDFVRVGASRIEGKGAFAKRKIPRGTRIIEYLGERLPATVLLEHVAAGQAASQYVFRLNDTMVIDGAHGGNEARFINHSCDPNCEAYVFEDRLYVYAMRDIVRGEELRLDYQLGSLLYHVRGNRAASAYPCRCGAPNCRGHVPLITPRSSP